MKLEELLRGLSTVKVRPGGSGEVVEVCYDSRRTHPRTLFVAVPGTKIDGHDFASRALEGGAAGAVVERESVFAELSARYSDRHLVLVKDARLALADLSAALHVRPSERLALVGITGTNGKTTTSFLVESILRAAGLFPGLIGTISYRVGGETLPSTHTTPESVDLDDLLSRMSESGAKSAVLEVSSHALAQHRVAGLEFDAVVFTNLTQDHLDFHKDLEDYFQAKRRLFTSQLDRQKKKKNPACVINAGDSYGKRLLSECRAAGRCVFSYALEGDADLRPEKISWNTAGIHGTIHTPAGILEIRSHLVGEHNVLNILAAVGAGIALNISLKQVAAGIEALERVPGRLDPVPNKLGLSVLVDYAHSPDALENVLSAARKFSKARVICVFGCGGDRDRTKRAPMARAVSRLSDLAILTSDNPRTEDPLRILADAREGLSGKEGEKFFVEADRRKAIALAIGKAKSGDVVLIAGKGHEDYQIIGTVKHHFDDREEAAAALAAREKAR